MASQCIAVDQPTASVFHCMRALETVIGDLCAEAKVIPNNPSWERALNDIAAAINKWDETARGPKWKEDKHFFSSAVGHLRTCQRAWRNYVTHAKDRYARSILAGIRAFLIEYQKKP